MLHLNVMDLAVETFQTAPAEPQPTDPKFTAAYTNCADCSMITCGYSQCATRCATC